MPSKTVTVGSSVGLHARPAAIISEAAGELDAEVTLAVPGEEPVDASSSLLIMTLGAACGDQVEVASEDQAARRRDRRPGREGPGRLASPRGSSAGAARVSRGPAPESGRPGRVPPTPWTAPRPGHRSPGRRAWAGTRRGRAAASTPSLRVLREPAALVDVRTAEGERGGDAVQAGQVRGAVRDVEVGRAGRRLDPVHDPADPPVAPQHVAGVEVAVQERSGRTPERVPRAARRPPGRARRRPTRAARPASRGTPTTRRGAATTPAPGARRGWRAGRRPARRRPAPTRSTAPGSRVISRLGSPSVRSPRTSTASVAGAGTGLPPSSPCTSRSRMSSGSACRRQGSSTSCRSTASRPSSTRTSSIRDATPPVSGSAATTGASSASPTQRRVSSPRVTGAPQPPSDR